MDRFGSILESLLEEDGDVFEVFLLDVYWDAFFMHFDWFWEYF